MERETTKHKSISKIGVPESLSLVLIQRNMIGIVPKYFQEAGARFRV